MTRHATPEQWAEMEQWTSYYSTSACLVELRDRISALESQRETEKAQRETEKACIQGIYDELDWLKIRHESNWSRIVKLEEAHQQPEPIDEEENERRFRACLAAIDNTTPEQVKAAVAKASANHSVEAPKMVPAPAGGLVELVAGAQFGINPYRPGAEETLARAAILAVAEWLRKRGRGNAACELEQEVERG